MCSESIDLKIDQWLESNDPSSYMKGGQFLD
jgi:hypothetical protein